MSTFLTVVISNLCIITFCQKYVFVDDLISSLDAEAECLSRHGTHLASIHNAADNAQAQSLCKPQPTDDRSECWIGLHDFDVEAYTDSTLFKWYDGTPIDYQNWRPGELNEYYPFQGEDLVSIMADTGQWQDEFIDRRLRLICWNPLYLYNDISPNTSVLSTETMTQSTKSIDSTTIEPITTMTDTESAIATTDAISTDAISQNTSVTSLRVDESKDIRSSNILSTEIEDKKSTIQFEYNETRDPGYSLIHGLLTAIIVVLLGIVLICVIGVYLYLERGRKLKRQQTEEIIVITIEENKANVNKDKNAANIVYDDRMMENVIDNNEKLENDDNEPGLGEMRYRRTVEGERSPTQSLDMDELQNNPNIADDEFIVVTNSTVLI